KQFFHMVSSSPTKIAIFGPVLSSVTGTVAAISRYWNLIEISHTATSMQLVDRKIYPYFFRTSISDICYNPARVAFVKRYNWKRVGIIFDITDAFLHAVKDLQKHLQAENIVSVTTEGITDNSDTISGLKNKDVRIIFLFAYPSKALPVLCNAYHQKLFGSHYVWMLPGFYLENWFINDLKKLDINCTSEQIQEVIEGYVAFKNELLPVNNEKPLSGYTINGFIEAYNNFSNGAPLSGSYSYAYDAIWALALGLNRTDEILREKYARNLSSFNYNDNITAHILVDALNNVSFIGLSGRIAFVDGNRVGNVMVMQYQSTDATSSGFYNYFTKTLSVSNEPYSIKWQGNFTPADGENVHNEWQSIPTAIYIVFACLAMAGVLLTTMFMIFNITMQNDRRIKISSPKINIIMLVGAMLCFFSVMFFGLDWKFVGENALPAICTSAAWTLCIGFTLGFGSLFWKTWRVYTIYRNKTKRSIIIKDRNLIVKIFGLAVIDIIILVFWQTIDPLYVQKETAVQNNPTVTTHYIAVVCTSKYLSLWTGIIYGYKFLLMIFGAFLAWETRSVAIKELNDSKLIGLCIYNVFVLCTTGVLLTAVINTDPITSFCLIASFIILCTTLTIVLIFSPKVNLHSNCNNASLI
ncbi:uncharacterized protein TRIADDRAFT_28937, partial [Trichoplax adhaerens]